MITVPHVWGLATKPLKMILSSSLAESKFSRNAQREEIPTLDSITASGGTGLLRMRLSPLCMGKITCKYNIVLLICFVPGFFHPNSTDMKDNPQATVVFPVLLLKLPPTQTCQAFVFAHIPLPNSLLTQLPGKKMQSCLSSF